MEPPADLQRIATELAQVSVLDRAERIGKALMDERERAARIAEDDAGHFLWGTDETEAVIKGTCEDIAAAIRQGNPR
jgi:DUF917 family protein